MGLLDSILGMMNSGQLDGAPNTMQGAPPSGYLPPPPQQDAPQPMVPMPGQNLPPDFAGGVPMPRPRPLESIYDAVPMGQDAPAMASGGADAPRVAREGMSPLAGSDLPPRLAREGGSPAGDDDTPAGGLAAAVMGPGGITSANALDPYAPQSADTSSTDVSARGRPPISVPLGPANAPAPQAAPAAPAQDAPSSIDTLIAQLQQRQRQNNNPVGQFLTSLGGGMANMKSSPFAAEAFASGAGGALQAGAKSNREDLDQQVKLLDTAIRAKNAGNTDLYRQSMMALQQSRLAETTRQHDLSANKTPAGYVRNQDGTMSPIKGGPADPQMLEQVARSKRQGSVLSDDAISFSADRVIAGDIRALARLSPDNVAKVQTMVAQKAAEQGINPSDILEKVAEASGLGASQRTFGTQVARMAVNSTEAQGAINLGREASDAVGRTNWVPVNKAIQAYQSGTSDPKLARFGASNLAIINTYSRAISPTGTPTVHDKEEAQKLLSTATGPEAYEAVLSQMEKEIDIAHKAPTKAKEEMERIRKSGTAPAGAPAAAPGGALPRVNSPADAKKLPSGSNFIDPNGVVRTVP